MISTISDKNFWKIPLSEPVINGNEWKYIKECLDTGWVSAGGFLERFEKNICKYTGAKYAAACINGSSALQVALRLVGVEAGSEAIVPALTFIAPVNAVKYLNAEPVFMDCDNYMNIDPEKLEQFCREECKLTAKGLKNKRSSRIIKAVVVVHVLGNPADITQIKRIAGRYKLSVVEDAAESLGAYYTAGPHKNRHSGTIGDIGIYSFNGNKIITTGGGGMIVSSDSKLINKARYLINQAKDDSLRYLHHEIGYNFRLTNLQAAIGVAQLENLDSRIRIKKRNYQIYRKSLAGVEGFRLLEPPEYASANFWLYSLIINKEKPAIARENLMQRLKKNGIQSRPLWYLNHLQKPYRNNQTYKIEKAVWFWERVLNLPSGVDLKEEQIKTISRILMAPGAAL